MTPKKSEEWQVKFIRSLAKCGNVTIAAKSAGKSRQAAYAHRSEDDAFADLWSDAMDAASDVLEEEARRRAQDGVLEPVFHQGVEVANVRKYSDTLLIFLLKGAKPQKYKDRQEVSGPNNGPVAVQHTFDELRKMEPDALVRLHRTTIGDTTENR